MTRTWFITGTSRGLGRNIAEAALASGDNVVATARKPEQLDDLTAQYGERVLALALDVTDADAVRAAIATAIDTYGSLDVVVNNAGYGDVASIEDVTDADFRAQIDANFYGTYYVSKAAVPHLREQGSGHIFQISSVGGRVGNAGLAGYQSAKFAVEGFSEVLAQEVAPFGVKVTLIEPGAMRTDWAGSSMTIPDVSEPYQPTIGAMAQMMRQFDGQQGGDPKKVAEIIVSLALRDDAPLRLLMGADAYEIATKADRERGETDARWRELTESIAFDTSTDTAQ
jgi:NAD(P)-dependent dehydrogenase (short-subunit alcohol dehydrogenase family)